MELRFSVLARNRQFAKAMRRIRSRLAPLTEGIADAGLKNARYQAILVGITDEKGPDYFAEVPHCDGFFQILAGCQLTECDTNLANQVFAILGRAALSCPLSAADGQKVQEVLKSAENSLKAFSLQGGTKNLGDTSCSRERPMRTRPAQ